MTALSEHACASEQFKGVKFMAVNPTERATPRGLRAPGRRLWRSVNEKFSLSEAEMVALEAACRLVDEIRRMEAELKDAPLLMAGSKGQTIPHPLLRRFGAIGWR